MTGKGRSGRRRAKPAKARAKLPDAGKPPKSEASKDRQLEKRLEEALEQQTATAEILRAMSGNPGDLAPVLDTIARNAARVCGAHDATIHLCEAGRLRMVAHHGPVPVIAAGLDMPISRGLVGGRAVLDRELLHVHDLSKAEDFPEGRDFARRVGFKTILAVPLVREGAGIGVVTIRRVKAHPFTDEQVALLQTFTDQALIAIENVRLFKELERRNADLTEALEQQTATAEILRVISTSPTDLQPVLDAVVRSAARFCGAYDASIFHRDGGSLRRAAHHGPIPFPIGPLVPLGRGRVAGRAILERQAVHVADLQGEAEEFPEGSGAAREYGHRTTLSVPLLREGVAIGAILLRRTEVDPFTDKQIALLQTFADQAVIAIENVRLFKELQARNRELTVALDQQTATSEILRVISSSQTDVQPVFDTVARSAVRLCGALFSAVWTFDGKLMHLAAEHNWPPDSLRAVKAMYPARPNRAVGGGRAILDRLVVRIEDVLTDPEYGQTLVSSGGWRSNMSVPMLREGVAIGAISVAWAEPGPFAENHIELLKTFADQAVIAIENVRLFKELEARTGELTRSVDQLTALGEVSRAVSSTLDVETVLDTIVSRASQLAGADGCSIYEYDEATQLFHLRAAHDFDPALVEGLRAMPLRKGEGAMGRATEAGQPIQIADIAVPGAYESHLRDVLIDAGFRALLSVPLLREEQIIGSLSLNRNTPGEFPPEVIEVLKTFATQSALAIQNARLFREIADKSRQLEVASRHKSEFLANMSHELRTPLNAIIGFSEVLNERMFGELNDKQAEYLKDIHASGTHLLSLINDILDLSKIEAGRMELEMTDFDLPSAIDSALTLVRERAARRGITLRTALEEKVGAVRGDERKIRQVVLNLLSNAIKFTPEGGRIEVGAVPVDGCVEVSVSDSGVGIAPEDQDAVFEEFRQVGASAARQEGTGLGLTLCRKFVELHGGRIRVASQVGVGSTFTFTIPVHRAE